VLGALVIAFSGILVRVSEVSPSTAAFFRCAYALPLLALLAWLEDRRYTQVGADAPRGTGGAAAVRATYGGEPGHPVLLEHDLFEALRDVSGDKGARNLLLSVPVLDVPCDDLGGGEDVDTPAELDALRAGGSVTGAPLGR